MQLGQQIATMINYLTDKEQALVYELVKRLVPDDVATAEDLLDIAISEEEYQRGDIVRHEDIDWD